MRKNILIKIAILLLVVKPALMFAQNPVEMADNFRSEGKIYVVVAVIAVILFGIFFYLYRTEQKINDLSDKLNK